MKFERKMKKRGTSKLNEIVPNNFAKPSSFPIWAKVAIPIASGVLATSLVLGIVLPLSLNNGKDNLPPISSIDTGEIPPSVKANGEKDVAALNALLGITGANENNSSEESPYPSFRRVLEGDSSLLRIRSGYDESVTRKIALALPKNILAKNNHYKEQGNTLDAWFMYRGGCIYEGEMMDNLSAYSFSVEASVPSSIEGQEVVGLYYEGYVSILDDVTDDLNIDFPARIKQYYKVNASLNDKVIIESPTYGYSEDLRYREYKVTKDNLEGLKLYQTERIASIAEEGINLSSSFWSRFFDSDCEEGPYGRPFHIPELQPYLSNGEELLSYAKFKEIAAKYKDFYRNEVPFEAKAAVYDNVDPSKRNMERSVYRTYQDYLDSPLSSWGCAYEEDYFSSHILATYTFFYDGQYGTSWDEILFQRAYRKGEETYIEAKVTFSAEPVKYYAKTLVVEIADEELATPSYDPIFVIRFGG